MKRSNADSSLLVLGIALWLGGHSVLSQTTNLAALELVPAGQVPIFGSFWSMAQPNSPPTPGFILRDLGIEVPVYALGPAGEFLVDDRGVEYPALPGLDAQTASLSTSGGASKALTEFDCGCGLWLDITASGSNANASDAVLLRLFHAREGQIYTIWSTPSLSPTNWAVETNLVGATNGYTEALISMGTRSNLFFRASGPGYPGATNYVLATNFPALCYSNTLIDPPDTMGAAGPNHFVELLNGTGTNQSAITVYSKSGAVVAQTNTLDFFRLGTNAPVWNTIVDVRIVFDRQAQRWVACGEALAAAGQEPDHEVVLAVSKTDSPVDLASGWTKHLLRMRRDQLRTDFPTLGLDGNGLYLTALMLSIGNTNMGHTVIAIKKPEIYAGILITNRLDIFSTNTLPVWTIQPAVNFDNVAPDAYAWFVAKGGPNPGTNYQGGAIYYRRLQWSDTNIAWGETNWIALSETATNYRNYYDLDGTNIDVLPPARTGIFAPEVGRASAFDLQAVGSRLCATVIRGGVLWTCQTIGLDTINGAYTGDKSGASVNRSGVQWLKLNVAGDSLSYNTHGRLYDPAASNAWYYCVPSMMVNCAGDIAMGFSGTSALTNMGAFCTYRLADGTMPPEPILIRAGTAFVEVSARWGDYSATTLDPADDWTFWTVQQYADPSGDPGGGSFPWRTIIAKVKTKP